MFKILLLEDDDSVNRGISFTLEREGYHVYSCAGIRTARQLFEQHRPDLLICDINLPDGSGLDFIKMVRSAGNTYIICLTAMDNEVDFVMGYEAGADDYIAKPFSLSVLSLKVQAFFQRRQALPEEEIRTGHLRVSLKDMKVYNRAEEISLTKNEWKLLRLFLNHSRQVLSKSQILEQLFDAEGDFVDENTIAVNIRRLREKIETDCSKPEYIKNIRGIGYIWAKECGRS